MAGNTPGPASQLTDELSLEIRKCILKGMTVVDILVETGIAAGTWDVWYWSNYEGFRTKIQDWKRERMVLLAEKGLEEIAEIQTTDAPTLKIKQDTLKFLTERLNKPKYAVKQEVDHTSGGNPIQGFNYVLPKDDDSDTTPNTQAA